MKILITGACGFLGRNLVEHLERDHELVLLDRPPNLFDETVQGKWFLERLIYHFDINQDIEHIKDKMRGVDVVIHAAARARISPSWAEYPDYYRTNISGSQRMLSLCQKMGVKKFIYISSSSVYGNNGQAKQSEAGPTMPTNPYAVSKLAAEHALRVQAQDSDTELVIVRPFTMYGQYMDYSEHCLVIAKFLRAWRQGEPLLIDGGGIQRRDFIHADDAVRGLDLIIKYAHHGDIYNLGTGHSVSIKELADVISDRQIITPLRKGHVDVTCADMVKLKLICFVPRIRVIDWLRNTVEEIKITNSKTDDKEDYELSSSSS